MEKLFVTNIQRYSVNDGPGIRTTVFLKGCPLSCYWCHNPECIRPYQELRFINEKCNKCGACSVICPENAIPLPAQVDAGAPKIDRNKCTRCMKCIAACSFGALVAAGEPLTLEDIITEVKRDRAFYGNSGGGMTLSGGEPLNFPAFTRKLLEQAQAAMIHTCLDTCGDVEWEVLDGVLDCVDLLLYDLKHMDSRKHEEGTGVPNDLLLQNAERAIKKKKAIIRIPIIPGFNNSVEDMEDMAKFVKSLGSNVLRCDLLPFHNWAQSKYESLGLKYSCSAIDSLESEAVKPLEAVFLCYGISTQIGG